MAHIKKEPRFGNVGGLCLPCGLFQLGGVDGVLVAAQFKLPVAGCGQRGQHQQQKHIKGFLGRGDPARGRAYLKIPGIVGHGAGNFQCVRSHGAVALGHDDPLTVVALLPNQVLVGGIL